VSRPGNVRLRELAERFKNTYKVLKNSQKRAFAQVGPGRVAE
jgi:hypothetical protein